MKGSLRVNWGLYRLERPRRRGPGDIQLDKGSGLSGAKLGDIHLGKGLSETKRDMVDSEG